ncbi:MAG: mechanosensitive ion channel [Thiomicrospira sp.]|uniref:mechanosensitive ion channel family protein n=1 Tax=Thiomicrospira sp. TaxID=935 RepID=UPI0019F58B70|nr:mechanosensitive ion channel domain-containing protein [Thiomicrospira sp.]MBE0494264.1 mechanosensitive ion channel [Thiomicrospira sp.]
MFENVMSKFDLVAFMHTYLIPWGINIAIALVIFFVGRIVISMLHKVLGKLMTRLHVKLILVEFTQQVVRALLFVMLIIAVLSQVGFDTTSLVAVLAAGSLAVGLALKDSLQNFAAGVMLIVLQPFKENDFVEVAGHMGMVEKVMLFSTLLRTTDNREITIPNGQIYATPLINYSARDTRRLDLIFGIDYSSDLRKAKQILQEILAADERVLKEPESLVVVSELANSSVNFTVRAWVNTSEYWPLRFDLIERVKLAFDDQGIEIPFPQMSLHFQQDIAEFMAAKSGSKDVVV